MSTVSLNAVLDGSPLVTDWKGRTRHLTGGEKAVLVILAHRSMADGSNIYVSIKRVTRESGFTERHVLNVVNLLRTNDLLTVTDERLGKSTIYALDLDLCSAVEDAPEREKGRWRGDGREEPEERDPEEIVEPPLILSVVPRVVPDVDDEIVASVEDVYRMATGGSRP